MPVVKRALALGLCALLAACGSSPRGKPEADVAAPQAGEPSQPTLSDAEADAKFFAFLRDFRSSAVAAGISPQTYDTAIANIHRNARVEQLNLSQPEFTAAVWSYLDSMVSDRRIADGQQAMQRESQTLSFIEIKYGVPREILAAIWGDESNYGQAMGTFNLFEALATLAYNGPRMEFGRREFLAALQMVEKYHFKPAEMTASWAGAFGQTQFVPSSFLAHAVDGDGNGTIDLWTSPADALASTAALLADAGWKRGSVCGYEVSLPQGFDYSQADPDTVKPLTSWTALGVKTVTGATLSVGDGNAAVFLPAGARGPAFLVFDNFKTILKYNNAAPYALAICTLAGRLRGEGPVVAAWPRDEQPLNTDERKAFQTALKSLGFDPGAIDGVLGHGTRAALRAWQKAHGVVADGFPTKALLAQLTAEAGAKS
jgi:peptidoglycan lytic transglycosylase B